MIRRVCKPIRMVELRSGTFSTSLLLALLMLILVCGMLASTRNQTWRTAAQNSDNIRQSIAGEIQSQLDLYGTMLDVAAGLVSGPESGRPSQATLLLTLKRMDLNFDVAGIIIVIDKDGHALLSSSGLVDQKFSFADRPYFQVQRDRTDAGLYVSQPYRSRLRNDEPTISLSRRVSDANGNFAGVVVAALNLRHFQTLFSRIHLGQSSALSLINTDGVILMRDPSTDGKGDVGHDVSGSINFHRADSANSGSYIAVTSIDGIKRLVSYGWVEGYPLRVYVSVSTKQILSDWWRQATIVGGSSLIICGAVLVLALGLRRKVDELEVAQQVLFLTASTDQLTGLANRREFDSLIGREWQRGMRDKTPLSILMVDADHFKLVNDMFGHAEGDEVLKCVAFTIRNSLKRAGDVVARYGGEEFAIILPNTDARGAFTVAEAVREAVLSASKDAHRNGRAGVTVSIGAASQVPSPNRTLHCLIKEADSALYESKRRGRNQTWIEGHEGCTVIPLRIIECSMILSQEG